MRGFRSTLILLVVFLGLLGYMYFFGAKKPAGADGTGPDAAAPKVKVFAVEADKIEELQIKAAGGERTTLKRANGAWSLVAPEQVKADDTEVTSIATNLASLERSRIVDDNPSDIAQYGLATPRVEVAFRKAGDKDLTRIFLGEKTATGTDLYAKLPADKAVFLVASFLDGTFNRTPFDLRDKKVLAFDREKVTAVEVTGKTGPISIALAEAKWQITKPAAARADLAAVDGLIGRIQTAQMKSIVAANIAPKDLAKYGLDKPDVRVSLVAGSARASLAIGKTADATTAYAMDESRPVVFTVETSLATDLRKRADDYRPKDLFEFKPNTAVRVDFTRGKATMSFDKVKAKDGKEGWVRRPAASQQVDTAKFEAVLSSLSSISADEFVGPKEKTGLNAPAVTVVVKYDQTRTETVTFARVGGNVFAARKGDGGAAKITPSRLDEFLKALDEVK